MPMSSADDLRLLPVPVGLAAAGFSVAYVVADVIELVQGGFSPVQLALTYAAEAALPLFVIGLFAVQRPRIGRLGLVGAVGYAYAYIAFTATVVYSLVENVDDWAALTQRLETVVRRPRRDHGRGGHLLRPGRRPCRRVPALDRVDPDRGCPVGRRHHRAPGFAPDSGGGRARHGLHRDGPLDARVGKAGDPSRQPFRPGDGRSLGESPTAGPNPPTDTNAPVRDRGVRERWRCRESNPGPPSHHEGFSVRSPLCLYSDPPVTRTSRCDDPSRCLVSPPVPRPDRQVSPLADAGIRGGNAPGPTAT